MVDSQKVKKSFGVMPDLILHVGENHYILHIVIIWTLSVKWKIKGRFLKKAWQKLFGYGFFCFKNICSQLVIKNRKSFGSGLENPFSKEFSRNDATTGLPFKRPDSFQMFKLINKDVFLQLYLDLTFLWLQPAIPMDNAI